MTLPPAVKPLIAIDATALQTGHRYRGIGSYAAGLLDEVTRAHHDPPIGLLMQEFHPDDHDLVRTLTGRPSARVIPLHKVPWRRDRLQWLFSRQAIYQALREIRPCLYHALEPNGVVTSTAITTVVTLHDLIPLHDPGTHFPRRWLDQRIGYAGYLHSLKRAARIIADSSATKQDAIERLRINPERISVVPLAVNDAHFYPRSSGEIDAVIARYNVQRPYFLHIASRVGPADNNKNTDNILQAFRLISRQVAHAGHVLCIAGKWSVRAINDVAVTYAELVRDKRLRLLGFVPDRDLPALYSGADALVYPSLIEGFGLPVLEAMRCGSPVLTSNVSSLPEVAGDAALLVDPHRIDEISGAMQRLADDSALRTNLKRRGLARASTFSWHRTARQTWQVYNELLEGA